MFRDKVLAITGGTGSFGRHVVKHFLKTEISEIRIFSRDEKKQEEMRLSEKDSRLRFYIGDVRDRDSITRFMRNVDYLFHAAALKQVPSCEFHPLEAVKTNVLGAANVLDVAVSSGVSRVVVLSTDKAVYPINAMGQSKALMEKVMVATARSLETNQTTLCATRYGNVMASRGSVIPLFISQIKAGADISVTDPSMTRFLMSLDDSVRLVFHAFERGEQGDIYIQKAPACTIGDLVVVLKDIFNANNRVCIIGTRHGEKLYESLVSREEMVRAVDSGPYYRIPPDGRDLNYSIYVSSGEPNISDATDYTSHNAVRLSRPQLKELLLGLTYVKEQLAS